MNGRAGRNIVAVASDGLASLLLLISAIWLPWAAYRSSAPTMTFDSGRVGLVLMACGAGSLGLVVVSLLWEKAGFNWMQLTLACTALICSVAIALSKIADANHAADSHSGSSTTSYGVGAGLAVVASVVMVVSSVVQLRSTKASGEPRTGQLTEAAAVR